MRLLASEICHTRLIGKFCCPSVNVLFSFYRSANAKTLGTTALDTALKITRLSHTCVDAGFKIPIPYIPVRWQCGRVVQNIVFTTAMITRLMV